MKILAIIPARGGSKGIPSKNIAMLKGKPLLRYTIEAAVESRLIDKTVVTSDDDHILEVAKTAEGVVVLNRPENLAQDDTPTLPVIQHAVGYMEKSHNYLADYIILLQPTSPLRTAKHIDDALHMLMANKTDSLVSVMEVPHQFNPYSIMQCTGGLLSNYLPCKETDNLRQKKPKFYARNGAAIYAFTRNCLINKNSIYGDSILPYFMSPEESVDIDTPLDLKWCEFIMGSAT